MEQEKRSAGNLNAFRSFEKIEMYNQNHTLYNLTYIFVQSTQLFSLLREVSKP